MASSFSIVAPDLWYYPYLRKFALLMVIEFLLLAFSLTWFGFVASRGKSTSFGTFFYTFFAFQCIDVKLETFLIVINLIYIPEKSDNIRNSEYVLKYSSEGYEKVLDRQIMVQYSILLNNQSAMLEDCCSVQLKGKGKGGSIWRVVTTFHVLS